MRRGFDFQDDLRRLPTHFRMVSGSSAKAEIEAGSIGLAGVWWRTVRAAAAQ
jgi:hypothetical protein